MENGYRFSKISVGLFAISTVSLFLIIIYGIAIAPPPGVLSTTMVHPEPVRAVAPALPEPSQETPVPTGSGGPLCLQMKIYKNDTPKGSIRLAVIGGATSGLFDKARFKVSDQSDWVETTTVNQFGEYYWDYKGAEESQQRTFSGQIHHTEGGWISCATT